jgi:hypothetical protein
VLPHKAPAAAHTTNSPTYRHIPSGTLATILQPVTRSHTETDASCTKGHVMPENSSTTTQPERQQLTPPQQRHAHNHRCCCITPICPLYTEVEDMQTLAAHDTGVHKHTKRETVMTYALWAAWNTRHGPEQDCVMHAVGTYSQINQSKETPTLTTHLTLSYAPMPLSPYIPLVFHA